MVGQHQDVATPLAQRGHLDVDDVDPVEEVLAESLLRHLVLQVAVGRGQDPGVEPDFGVSTDRPDRALLERAQELGLHPGRHLSDLVEEEGPARGLQEEPQSRLTGIREGPLHVTEELALEEVLRHRRAVDGDERPRGRALRAWMALATSSLPVPLSPVMSTVVSEVATRSMRS